MVVVRTVDEAIERLGGIGALAEKCDVGATAVRNWRLWKIFPLKHHAFLVRLAKEKRINIPDSLFGAALKTSKREGTAPIERKKPAPAAVPAARKKRASRAA